MPYNKGVMSPSLLLVSVMNVGLEQGAIKEHERFILGWRDPWVSLRAKLPLPRATMALRCTHHIGDVCSPLSLVEIGLRGRRDA